MGPGNEATRSVDAVVQHQQLLIKYLGRLSGKVYSPPRDEIIEGHAHGVSPPSNSQAPRAAAHEQGGGSAGEELEAI